MILNKKLVVVESKHDLTESEYNKHKAYLDELESKLNNEVVFMLIGPSQFNIKAV